MEQRSDPSVEWHSPALQLEGRPFKETSAVRVPTLVHLRSHTGPAVDDVVGAAVVVGAELPHQPSATFWLIQLR